MIQRYSPLIITWVILFCLTTLGFFLFRNFDVPVIWNIICGIGLIVVSYIIYAKNKKDNKESKEITDIKEELAAKVDYKVYVPRMEDIDRRLNSKAESTEVKGLRELIIEMDTKNENRIADLRDILMTKIK